jgi:hypothetical protein
MQVGHGERFSRNQEKAIAALLVAPSVRAAAKRCEVHPNTLRNWLRNESFAAAYREAKGQLLAVAVGACLEAVCAAVGAMKKDLRHPDPDVRHRAARTILEAGCSAIDRGVLLVRLERLESQLGRRES